MGCAKSMAKRQPPDRDGALLYLAQRLGENPNVKPATILKELREQGRGYRKQEFLKDFAGVAGKPQTIKPGAIKGGIVSGVMRRKDVKSLSKDQQKEIKQLTRAAIDATADNGQEPWRKLKIVTAPGGTLAVEEEMDEDDLDDMEQGEIVQDSANVATIEPDNIGVAWAVMEHVYDTLT